MTSPGKEWLNVEGAIESGARSKRQTRPTQKALQSAVELKRRQTHRSRKRLLSVMQSEEGLSDDSHIDTVARDLTLASEEFGRLLQELIGLYEQDSRGNYLEEAQLSEENETLNRALLLLDSLKNRITRQSNKLLETRSVCSRRSSRHSSASKTSSTTARLQALAEAKAAREEAQYTRLIAQKELERRTREAEAQKIRQQEIAQFEKEIAILGADKKAAMANAKLKVFEEALLEEEHEKDFELPELEVPKIKAEERTSQWVHSNPLPTGKVSRSERNHEPLSTPEQIKLALRAISALTTSRAGVTPPYSALSAETSVTAPYCIRRSGHPLNRRMKQSTQNVPCSVDLQEACPAARLCWWTSIADVTHTSLSASMLSLMSRATVPSSLAN